MTWVNSSTNLLYFWREWKKSHLESLTSFPMQSTSSSYQRLQAKNASLTGNSHTEGPHKIFDAYKPENLVLFFSLDSKNDWSDKMGLKEWWLTFWNVWIKIIPDVRLNVIPIQFAEFVNCLFFTNVYQNSLPTTSKWEAISWLWTVCIKLLQKLKILKGNNPMS